MAKSFLLVCDGHTVAMALKDAALAVSSYYSCRWILMLFGVF